MSRVRHPNLVPFLGVFLYEEDNTISRNLLFPIAIGDLEQLFSGSINQRSFLPCLDSLWSQFEGLASGLQYLHDGLYVAHRDIQPSNILLYQHAHYRKLVAKLADFGLARALTWVPHTLISIQPLCYQDVWKLGTVFAELLTYLLRGTKGIKQFRAFITVTYHQTINSISEDSPYYENKVRSDVIAWLRQTPRNHSMEKEVAEITMRMLGSQDECPSAADVAEYLAEVSWTAFKRLYIPMLSGK